MNSTTEMRDAEIKDFDGYKLPEKAIDGYLIVSTHRTEETARKSAAKDGAIAFILRWQSEVGNNVYGLYITEENYFARRAAKKVSK